MPRRSQSLPRPSATASLILHRTSLRPRLAIILGSGFGPVAQSVSVEREFSYRDLPGFPVGGAPGHEGRLRIGTWHSVPVAVLSGRAHYYEGFEPNEVVFATRVLAAMGVETLLVTNAAGGIHPKFRVGDFMILNDHINFLGMNPLRGPVGEGEPRFVDMTRTYDPELQEHLKAAARSIRLPVREGVYLAVSGPSFETPAELFYWLNESKNANAEVDFVVSQGNLIMPVEVKAGKSGSLKSLHLFCGRRHLDHAVRFDLSPPSRQQINTSVPDKMGSDLVSSYFLHSLPLYSVEKLTELLKKIRLERK
jgi:purine-nucleoside phosphorylase